MDPRFENIPETALRWHRAGKRAALATVVGTWGSAPRRMGSQLAISGDADMAGSVSGGCVEGAVVAEALDALETGKPILLEYGVSDGDAFAVGLACGGTIRVLVEPVGEAMPEDVLAELCEFRSRRVPVACITGVTTPPRLVRAPAGQAGDDEAETRLAERFRLDRSGFEADGETFVAIHNPPLRLIVVGAVHIAQALVPMARIAGFDPVIVDPRAAFASQERFPGETIVDDWPDEALDRIGLDLRTAVVTLTHDPKLDDPALRKALDSDAFYIGALGSTRTAGKRDERLREQGIAGDEIARINGPVGLNIGASGPAEIAVSILAQIVQTLRGAG
ncbi:XdhC/CoxI family protein [Roseovarius sp. E0-M6]